MACGSASVTDVSLARELAKLLVRRMAEAGRHLAPGARNH